MLPEAVLGQSRRLRGGFVASVAALTELAALWPGDVVVEIVLLPPQLHVPATHGDVVEEDVAAGMSAHRGHPLVQQDPGSGLGAPFQDYQRRTRGQPCRIRLQEWTIRSPRPFRWAPNSTRCSFAKPGPDLWRMARDARSFELGPLLAARRVGAALSLLAGKGIAHRHVRRRLPIHEPG